ncbi:MAG: trypsin-like peptidase domain-containing protein [Caldilineaceae bacterium]|nr:trypsin-like peptidase domain-containing protein [Caldilineaceae bacterium]
MAWNQNLTNLRDWFADRYFTLEQAIRVVSEAGLKPRFIAFSTQPATNWFNILTYANHQHRVTALIDVVKTEYSAEKVWLEAAQVGLLTGVSGVDITRAVTWRGPADAERLEKIIGKRSTLLPIHFLEVGVQKAKAVVRIVLPNGESGSGFLTTNNLLITNHHVIPNPEAAKQVKVQCNFQRTMTLLDAAVTEYRCAPGEGFATSPMTAHDWTAVRLQGNPNATWGALPLGKATLQKGDWINIIQHPAGGPKQIALYDNLIVYADENRVQYLTDTLPGSSGSPCFDSDWNVVALHHSGGWLKEPGTKERYYRNEGILINRVIEGLVAAGLMAADKSGS